MVPNPEKQIRVNNSACLSITYKLSDRTEQNVCINLDVNESLLFFNTFTFTLLTLMLMWCCLNHLLLWSMYNIVFLCVWVARMHYDSWEIWGNLSPCAPETYLWPVCHWTHRPSVLRSVLIQLISSWQWLASLILIYYSRVIYSTPVIERRSGRRMMWNLDCIDSRSSELWCHSP